MRRPLAAVATALALAGAALLAGCGGDDEEGPPPFFPEDYAATYTEVRDCRRSLDHDVQHIRVLASPEALAVYQDRDAPFPEGAIVLKEQYADFDTTCSEGVLQWTVMRKAATGALPAMLDWEWQRVDLDRVTAPVDEQEGDPARCASCHSTCDDAPDGHDGTCAVP